MADVQGARWHRPARAVTVQVVYRGVVIAAQLIDGRRRRSFVVGSEGRTDAPVPRGFLDGEQRMRLVSVRAGVCFVEVMPAAQGQVVQGEARTSLDAWIAEHGTIFPVPDDVALTACCGELTFSIAATAPSPVVGPPPWSWRQEHRYTVATAASLVTLLALSTFVARDARSISLAEADRRLWNIYRIIPPERPLAPSVAGSNDAAAARSQAAEDVPLRRRAPARRAPARELHGRAASEHEARNAGIVALLGRWRGGALEAVLGSGSAVGDPSAVLGGLQAGDVAGAYGVGGLVVRGGGPGGGEATRGSGMIGTRGRSGNDVGFGRDVGRLRARRTRAPEVSIVDGQIRGALDKEIVRRVVRRHLNEVKFCYERALARFPSLAGRVVIQFAIDPAGRVASAAVASTTLGSREVEGCVTQAVRRWEFPKPMGGGLVW